MSGWFPQVSSYEDIILCSSCSIDRSCYGCNVNNFPHDFIFSLINSKDVRELKDKVGVLPESDGSGKTTSRIISSGGYIIKTDISITFETEEKAKHALFKILNITKRVNLSHPDKFFFVLKYNDKFIICSVCPELNTVHSIKDAEKRLKALSNIVEIGLKAIKTQQVQLDLNPSNFGFEGNNIDKLYYLDDEIYYSHDLKSIGEYIVCRVKYEPNYKTEDWAKYSTFISEIINNYALSYPDKNEILLGIKEYPTTNAVKEKIDQIINVLESELYSKKRKEVSVFNNSKNNNKVCIMADIHSNNYALESVLKEAKSLGVSKFIVLGDIVGYGPNPTETIDILSNLENCKIIKGNHDEYISKKSFHIGISSLAEESAKYTISVLEQKYLDWLSNLDNYFSYNNKMYIHASLCSSDYSSGYIYDMTYERNFKEAVDKNIHVTFYGHTHIPYIYIYDQNKELYIKQQPSAITLDKENKFFLINPGSVGQPRDKDPRSSFILMDEDTNEVTFHRVEYNYEKVVDDLKRNGLSNRLQNRFINGV